ncbi:disease resistance-like protein isoform X1 [Cinnamomum micranthum f. kanehirae]|uniref:Disease resistance-like protein isoform X1 n=1 Tax=Cinnamomum micranthum f. kanehirae TaxID=337451 RepID=A0A3S3PDH7_9MAGN|nr:disease resistance-like protein isoform X1 [Cinnamomum micranthum f. kanehirae]
MKRSPWRRKLKRRKVMKEKRRKVMEEKREGRRINPYEGLERRKKENCKGGDEEKQESLWRIGEEEEEEKKEARGREKRRNKKPFSLTCLASSLMENIFKWISPQISEEVSYVRNLKRNVEDLMEESKTLKAQCDDMESEGREASRKRMRLTNQSQTWLGHARANLTEIENIKSEFDQRQASNNKFFSNLPSTYTLGKRVVEKLESVRQDLNKRSGIKLLAMSSPPRVMEMDVPTVGQSSSQQTMEKIWDLLHDEHTSVICVYGMGGIGKTTLMKAINNKLQATGEFDYVIWVTVSKELNLQRIQKEIMSRLHLKFDDDDSYNSRSMQLHQYLTDKRYMLILDDLWDCIDLYTVGIPPNKNNRSRTAITTRLFQVCNDMKADAKIRVNALTEAEAWDLFAANVGEEVAHQLDIKDIAKNVAMECGGLPLAIIVVAKAMQGEKKKELWEDALRALRASVPEIRGMEPQVFRPLKLSYDDLRDEKVKLCFLYCSLFPEDYEIGVKRLVDLWIMEGFIDNVDSLVDASNKGHRIIEDLKRRCLLEEGIQDDAVCVKMHDIIRDLALYIASSSCNEGPKFLVKANVGLNEPPPEGTWREFERISLMRNVITELPIKPECLNLISLFLSENGGITAVPRSFFELMPALQVLDLSNTTITSLSVSSHSLLNLRALNLRHCYKLTEVPLLGQLKELQFLDVKSSSIRSLPKEMQNLVKLKKLNMSEIFDSLTIPSNVMSGLASLEDLRMHGTNVNWAKGSELAVENDVTLGEVEKLKRLTILKITIQDFDCVENDVFLQQLPKLEKFKVVIGPSGVNPLNILDCMKKVHIYGGNKYSCEVEVMVTHTEGLELFDADVKDVSQLVGVANGLRMLTIDWCRKMECILDWSDVGENALQNIEKLHLSLSSLQKLFKGEVPKRCLRKLNEIVLGGCNNLKSLFSSEMVQNLDQLQTLRVMNCNGLEKIIEGHDKSLPENPFPQLRNFVLFRLPKLNSIIRRDTLALPSLIKLEIFECPNLWLPKRPDTTDWPSITPGNATWQANSQQSEHMQRIHPYKSSHTYCQMKNRIRKSHDKNKSN